MRESTTVRVSRATRDSLRALAAAQELTLDQTLERLVKAERQRRIGLELGASEPDADDRSWLDLGAETTRADDARR